MKPDDVHLGVVDLFAIVLPGAIATAYFDKVGGRQFAEQLLPAAALTGSGGWVLYALAAYAAGHLVFLVAAQLDRSYDFVRSRLWPDKAGNAYDRTKALRAMVLGTTDDKPMNTFSWAKAVLQLQSKQAATDVARYEADEKFFRSLCVVLCVIGAHGVARGQFGLGLVLIVIGLAAYARYIERRYKSTQWAYYYVITLTSLSRIPGNAHLPASPTNGELTVQGESTAAQGPRKAS